MNTHPQTVQSQVHQRRRVGHLGGCELVRRPWGITRSEQDIAASTAVKDEALAWARQASGCNGFGGF